MGIKDRTHFSNHTQDTRQIEEPPRMMKIIGITFQVGLLLTALAAGKVQNILSDFTSVNNANICVRVWNERLLVFPHKTHGM